MTKQKDFQAKRNPAADISGNRCRLGYFRDTIRTRFSVVAGQIDFVIFAVYNINKNKHKKN